MIIKRSFIFFGLWFFVHLAHGHAMGSSFLHLNEHSPGKFTVRWVPAPELKYLTFAVKPQLPSHCYQQQLVIDCGNTGLVGVIDFENLPMHADIVVRIEWLNGNQHTEVLTNNSQSITLTEANITANNSLQLITSYMVIGIEHILWGIDHLLFVAGLILLIGFNRQLIWTITSFTVAHSLTLVLSVIGVIQIPQTPVEILIALSIVLLAVEALNKNFTLARRCPWLVALLFGLVHGMGFADALRAVGLPEHELPLSLFAFNLGVELGQLGVILCVYLMTGFVMRLFNGKYQLQPALVTATYVIGSLGAYWTVSRTSVLFGAS